MGVNFILLFKNTTVCMLTLKCRTLPIIERYLDTMPRYALAPLVSPIDKQLMVSPYRKTVLGFNSGSLDFADCNNITVKVVSVFFLDYAHALPISQ